MGNCIKRFKRPITVKKRYRKIAELVNHTYYETPNIIIDYNADYIDDFDSPFENEFITIFVEKIFPKEPDSKKYEYAHMLYDYFAASKQYCPKHTIKAMQLKASERDIIIYRIRCKGFNPLVDKVLTISSN